MSPELAAAVARLRARACWQDVPALLPGPTTDFPTLLALAATAVERCAYTNGGWQAAAEAVREAVRGAASDAESAQALCEEAFLCYARTVFAGEDHATEATDTLHRAGELAAADSPLRPLLTFRHGLMTENLHGDPEAARESYARAHQAALDGGDDLFASFTFRHLAIVDFKAGRMVPARDGFARSLELREKVGFLIGVVPALSGLARVSDEPEASRLRAESSRLVRVLGLTPRLSR